MELNSSLNNEQLKSYIDQIIDMARAQAQELDTLHLQQHKASKTVGENSLVFHLKQLKQLVTK